MIKKGWEAGKVFFLKHWKRILPATVLFVILLALAVPLIRHYLAFQHLPLEDIESVTLVQYAGEPFSSSVEWVKRTEDDEAIRSMVLLIREGKRPLYSKGTIGRQVVFIHGTDGSSLPGFLDGEKLGFQYGQLWVETEGLKAFLEQMTDVPLVEVRDPSQETDPPQ